MVSALAGAGAASAASAATRPEPLSSLTTRTVRLIITNNTGGTLTLLSKDTYDGNSWRESPTDIPDHGVGDFTVVAGNHGVGGWVRYALPRTFHNAVEISGLNDRALPNRYGCDMQVDSTPVPKGPYKCDARQDKKGWNDTNIYVEVDPS
jgi:hypothetical protein